MEYETTTRKIRSTPPNERDVNAIFFLLGFIFLCYLKLRRRETILIYKEVNKKRFDLIQIKGGALKKMESNLNVPKNEIG